MATDKAKIKETLSKLDTKNDNQWTTDGLPKLEIVRLLSGDQKLSREDLLAVDPEFTRQKALLKAEADTNGIASAAGDTATARDQAAAALSPADEAKARELGLGMKADGTAAVPGQLVSQLAVNKLAVGVEPGTLEAMKADPQIGVAKDGTVTAPNGATLNPTADSDNQPPNRDTTEADAKALMNRELELDEKIAAQEGKLNEMQGQIETAKRIVRQEQGVLDGLIAQKMQESGADHIVNQTAIMSYLEAQKGKLEQRAEEENETQRKTRRSPLDESLGRKRK